MGKKYEKWLEEENLIKIQGWARLGLSDKEIAKNMGVSESTFYAWKNKFPAFAERVRMGKEVVDFIVENALFKKATGYEAKEVKEYVKEVDGKITKHKEIFHKHIPPDTPAIIFFLKNRKPDYWSNNDAMLSGAMTEKVVIKGEDSLED